MARRSVMLAAVVITLTAVSVAIAARDRGAASPPFKLVTVASGLSSPIYVTQPAGDPRLFVVEQTGMILALGKDRTTGTPFADLTSVVRSGGEQGLLSVAFDPGYASNGRLYVDFTDRNGDTRVWQFHAKPGAARVDQGHRQILFIHQPYPNHNGGQLQFGPDGDLYVGMGDGGSEDDPQGNGQSVHTLLAKILRLDVDHAPSGKAYAIPRGQPIRRGARAQIYAYGVRNPWRFSFDRTTGDLWIGDVGQDSWEEVDHVTAKGGLGRNFGWNTWEGRHRFPGGRPALGTVTMPVAEYPHSQGCSITGGYVYRGKAIPALTGRYLYADYCSSRLWALRTSGGSPIDYSSAISAAGVPSGSISSFGQDAKGELYLCSLSGSVYKFVPS